jgi:hypothetical protein
MRAGAAEPSARTRSIADVTAARIPAPALAAASAMNLRRAALAGGLDSQQAEGRRNLEGAGVIILLGVSRKIFAAQRYGGAHDSSASGRMKHDHWADARSAHTGVRTNGADADQLRIRERG